MTNRSQKPSISNQFEVIALNSEKTKLSNGMPVYFLNEPDHDLIKIEFSFNAGTFYQEKKLTSVVTANLLKEGTKRKTSKEISEIFDYYGVYTSFDPQKDLASIGVFVLEKHLDPVLSLLEEILKEPSFPESELEIYLKNLKQQHIVSLEKVSNVARMQFSKLLFGEDHPYGQTLNLSDFDNIFKADIEQFHKKFYNANNVFCIVAGSTSVRIAPILEKHFGGNDWLGENNFKKEIISVFPLADKHLFYKENAVQSAVRVGKIFPGINHPDYHKIMIANVILGGYFGSRLMKNIRQEKGYTYGINSAIVSLVHGSYFFVTSQIGVEFVKHAIEEIYSEISILRKVHADEEEISVVKNYLSGAFLRSFDGVFAKSDRLKELIAFNLPDSHFFNYINTVNSINAEEIMRVADRYFNEKEMTELVVGKL